MQEIRQKQIIKQNMLQITLPENWKGKEVEIIIKPIENKLSKKERFKKLLLNGPTWSEEEYHNYLQGKEHLEKWNKI